MMALDRRSFCGAAVCAAVGSVLPGCRNWPGTPRRWYRGMLHCHTFWSDGRGFPEDAAKAYRQLGYDFLAITDHNRTAMDPDRWQDVADEEGPWPPKVSRPLLESYRRSCPHACVRAAADGGTQVRLQPFAETRRMFGEPGSFLLMPGVEITRQMPCADGNSSAVHMNCINVEAPIADLAHDGLISNRRDVSVREMIAHDYESWRRQTAAGEPSIFILNHPHWSALDVSPDDLIALPQVRYFEVCNNGMDEPLPKELPDDGWINDRFWDAVNAVRARCGERLLYALASDDAHWYPGNGCRQKSGDPATPGDGFICVRADRLVPAALFAAMEHGDFYASSGVMLGDVSFDGRTLSVSVPAKRGVRFTVRFIVSKRDFDSVPSRTLTCAFSHGRTRTVKVPGRGIGEVARTAEGRTGEPLAASYALCPDDLYVRARIESDEPSFYQPVPVAHPKVRCAWTQPFLAGDRR